MSNVFDARTASPPVEGSENPVTHEEGASTDAAPETIPEGQYTASSIKEAVQELLKLGVLEVERKPNLYQTAVTQRAVIDRILEPLDLRLHLDEIRGLAFVAIATVFNESDDGWNHPLVRRQRLTLEQSLLVALLRQLYVTHEQEQGIGAGAALIHLDDLLPQVQLYLGNTGSDTREEKRLRNLLEHLKGHGLVTDIDAKGQFTIRPLITHLANPQSLQSLLQHVHTLTKSSAIGDGEAAAPENGE